MSSRKRQLEESVQELPETKKQKSNVITSQIFTLDGWNEEQFQEMFTAIDSCELLVKLSIPQDITKEIAEYATGDIEYCANNKCGQDICTLPDDEHPEDAAGDEERGYAYCEERDNYWCFDCVDGVDYCQGYQDCLVKIHSSEWRECGFNRDSKCEQFIKICGDGWDECLYQYCKICDRYACDECYPRSPYEMNECKSCNKSCCDDCCRIFADAVLCIDCYDNTMIMERYS